jgi:hypothetical protein
MLHKKRFFLTSLSVLALAFSSFGQVAKSPYSTFGLGDTYGNSLAQNQGMGGVGISNASSWYINNQNPALLTANYVTSFQAGLILESRTVNDGSSSLKNGSGNLNYLVMAFPIKPGRWTTSLGLMPYSSVNYKLSQILPVDGSATSTYLDQKTGSGGINQFYWANGVKVHKYVSLGVRASYLFSSIINEEINVLNQPDNRLVAYYASKYERNYVKDLSFSVGSYFHLDSLFKKNYRINVGVIYGFKSSLSTQRTLRQEERSIIRGSIVDSVTLVNNEPGSITLPQTLGLGVSFGRVNHWTVGADLNVLDYNQFKGFTGASASPTTTGIKTALGFEYVPDPTGIGNYLKRMTYRTGVSYERYPYLVGGNQVKDLGVNFGVSLPVGRLSTLDLSLKIGKRGNASENLIEENYFKLYFGMTFNDQWFIKRKFD